MDALDRLAEPGLDLLGRVDALLAAAGAPEGHRLWPLLRRMQVLPGRRVRRLPRPASGAAGRRRARGAPADPGVRRGLRRASPTRLSGPAPAAYRVRRACGPRCCATSTRVRRAWWGGLESTAGYADALADWVEGSRGALARALAELLGSAEAVTVAGADPRRWTAPGVALAAAEIGARVLGVLGVAYDGAETLLRQWGPSLAESLLPAAGRDAGGLGSDDDRVQP